MCAKMVEGVQQLGDSQRHFVLTKITSIYDIIRHEYMVLITPSHFLLQFPIINSLQELDKMVDMFSRHYNTLFQSITQDIP
jgi:hypothetical protein